MKLPGFLGAIGGWQGYAAAAGLAALLSIGATYYIVSLPYKLTISNMERDAAKASADASQKALDQFKADADKIHDAAVHYTALQSDNDDKFARLERELRNAFKIPLPPDCLPDPPRVQSFSAAVKAANDTAAGRLSSPAVPATP